MKCVDTHGTLMSTHNGCFDAAAVGAFKDFVVRHVVLLFDSKDWTELLLVELFQLPYIATVDSVIQQCGDYDGLMYH